MNYYVYLNKKHDGRYCVIYEIKQETGKNRIISITFREKERAERFLKAVKEWCVQNSDEEWIELLIAYREIINFNLGYYLEKVLGLETDDIERPYNKRNFGCIYFDTSSKEDAHGRHRRYCCWRAEFQRGKVRKKKRSRSRQALEEWLDKMEAIYG